MIDKHPSRDTALTSEGDRDFFHDCSEAKNRSFGCLSAIFFGRQILLKSISLADRQWVGKKNSMYP